MAHQSALVILEKITNNSKLCRWVNGKDVTVEAKGEVPHQRIEMLERKIRMMSVEDEQKGSSSNTFMLFS